jgi:hypothetical protein
MAERDSFECNLCGEHSIYRRENLHREVPSCEFCGSTVRQRQLIHAYRQISCEDRPSKKGNPRVLGLSDHPLVEQFFLSQKNVHYVNTFVDEGTRLDVIRPPKAFLSWADFLISSDVLEHVPFPTNQALLGKFNVLKPGGWLLLTVPYSAKGPSVEHYPWMVDYETVMVSPGSFKVIGVDRTGSQREVRDPIFHGGPGKTLEMRQLAVDVVIDELQRAGFVDVGVIDQEEPAVGIIPTDFQGVFLARKPKRSLMRFRRRNSEAS